MRRPTYVTEQDKRNEIAVAQKLTNLWSCEAHRTPEKYAVDFALSRGGSVQAMAEVKFRYRSYPTLLLSLHKYTAMCLSSEVTGLPHLLVVSWPESKGRVIRYTRVNRSLHTRVVMGGRKDRGDPDDIEPMVEIPIEKFSLLREA